MATSAVHYWYFGAHTGLTPEYDAKLGAKCERAFERMSEADHELWWQADDAYRRAGLATDVACCKALDDTMPGWRRYRKTIRHP